MRDRIPSVVDSLKVAGLVLEDHGRLTLSQQGSNQVEEIAQRRRDEEDLAYGQFSTELLAACPAATERSAEMIGILRSFVVGVFRHRGIAIANAVFAGHSFRQDALGDVFSAISSAAKGIAPPDLAIAFMEAAQHFILSPTEHQRRYLASVSQGYFLYHFFGLDPTCSRIRRDVFEQTVWWCDSSILIPLLATGSANNEYASDLFGRLQALKAYTFTTERLLREIVEHLGWAIRLLERRSLQSPEVLEAATQKAGHKQNLFLDGYIRLVAEGKVGKFTDYLEMVAPYGSAEPGLRRVLAERGVRVINADQLEGFKQEDIREIFELLEVITEERQKVATLRSNLQVEAEAEILHVIRKLADGSYKLPDKAALDHTYFLSQSRVLDRIPPTEPISWTPEVLYRYIISLPGEKLDPDLLQRCMLQEYFGSGIEIVDSARYEKVFGPSIDTANTTYKAERDKYLEEVSRVSVAELDSVYASTPDLEKPFFVQQMGWRMASRERMEAAEARIAAASAEQRARGVEQKLAELERERDANWKRRQHVREQQLAAEERNTADPKRARKRRRQAKKRRR